MKKTLHLFYLLFLFIFLSSFAYGLGVGQEYLPDNTLNLNPGDEYLLKLILQNTDDVMIYANFTVISDIAEIKDRKEVYNLSPKTYNNEVFVEVKAPSDAKIGEIYQVVYSVKPVSKEGSSNGVSLRIRQSFDVMITEKINPDETTENDDNVLLKAISIAGLIVSLLVLWKISTALSKKLSSK